MIRMNMGIDDETNILRLEPVLLDRPHEFLKARFPHLIHQGTGIHQHMRMIPLEQIYEKGRIAVVAHPLPNVKI